MQLILKSLAKKKSKSRTGFSSVRATNTLLAISAVVLTVMLAACAAPEAQIGLSDLSARPGEKALLAGIRSYDDAQYPEAEKSLATALNAGFTVKKDAALAYKYLAFIYCTSARTEDCKRAFQAARASDPGFSLSKKEIGHPQWGPVYKQLAGE